MTIKATKNCTEKLIPSGSSAAEITMTLSIVLTPVPLFSDQVNQVVESDSVDSSRRCLRIIYKILVVLRLKLKQWCQALKRNAH